MNSKPKGVVSGMSFQPGGDLLLRKRILLTLSKFLGDEGSPADALASAAKIVEHHVYVVQNAECFDGAAAFGQFSVRTQGVNT